VFLSLSPYTHIPYYFILTEKKARMKKRSGKRKPIRKNVLHFSRIQEKFPPVESTKKKIHSVLFFSFHFAGIIHTISHTSMSITNKYTKKNILICRCKQLWRRFISFHSFKSCIKHSTLGWLGSGKSKELRQLRLMAS